MSYETITYEVDGHKATITMNRPDALNALSPHMITELRAAYQQAEDDDNVWLMIVTANGRAFCTGADVKEIPGDGKVLNERPYLSTYEQWEAPQEGTPPFRSMTKPVIVAVNGICCGAGLDWVTTGDIVIASDKATFFDPHVSIGLVAAREMVRLAKALPRSVALRMALMGKHERMTVQRAYDLGLITEIVEHDKLLERAHEIADTVNLNAPLAVRGTRLAIHKTLDLPLHEGEILAETFRERVTRTEDALEGPRAFVEKRKPNWQAPVAWPSQTILLDFDHDTPRRHHHAEPARRAELLQPRRCATRCATPGTPSRTTRASTRWCCGPPVTARSAPDWTSNPAMDSPRSCGTTRIPVSCSAPNGRRCGSRWSARYRACAPPARCTSSTSPMW